MPTTATPGSPRALPALLVLFLATPVLAFDLPVATPGSVDLSAERLQRLDDYFQQQIDAGELVGAVTAVARRGVLVHNVALGFEDRDAGLRARTDSQFKIASMTKPVTAVAIMMLVEKGAIRLDDPVSRYIPEFANLRVAEMAPGEEPVGRGQVPEYHALDAAREITILDLLTHTSGLGSGAMSNDTVAAIQPAGEGEALADYIPRLGATLLEFQPGSRWAYSAFAGFDTLGRVVEVASGIPFDRFLRERIFDPLGMVNVRFWPENDDWSSVASGYRKDDDGVLQKTANPVGRSSPTYFSGSAGLIASAEDFIPLGMLLANGGELNGVRLLSRKSVEMLSAVHVPDTMPGRRPGEGFGLGVRVVTDHAARGTLLSTGSYGWFGATGTFFFIDPVEELVGVMMVATPNNEISTRFETLVEQAIAD